MSDFHCPAHDLYTPTCAPCRVLTLTAELTGSDEELRRSQAALATAVREREEARRETGWHRELAAAHAEHHEEARRALGEIAALGLDVAERNHAAARWRMFEIARAHLAAAGGAEENRSTPTDEGVPPRSPPAAGPEDSAGLATQPATPAAPSGGTSTAALSPAGELHPGHERGDFYPDPPPPAPAAGADPNRRLELAARRLVDAYDTATVPIESDLDDAIHEVMDALRALPAPAAEACPHRAHYLAAGGEVRCLHCDVEIDDRGDLCKCGARTLLPEYGALWVGNMRHARDVCRDVDAPAPAPPPAAGECRRCHGSKRIFAGYVGGAPDYDPCPVCAPARAPAAEACGERLPDPRVDREALVAFAGSVREPTGPLAGAAPAPELTREAAEACGEPHPGCCDVAKDTPELNWTGDFWELRRVGDPDGWWCDFCPWCGSRLPEDPAATGKRGTP
jgi:hypothetical protein